VLQIIGDGRAFRDRVPARMSGYPYGIEEALLELMSLEEEEVTEATAGKCHAFISFRDRRSISRNASGR
jgi:hypothetical protein